MLPLRTRHHDMRNLSSHMKKPCSSTALAVSISPANQHSQLTDIWWSHVEQGWALPTDASPHCRFISKIMFTSHPYYFQLCWFQKVSVPPKKYFQQGLPWGSQWTQSYYYCWATLASPSYWTNRQRGELQYQPGKLPLLSRGNWVTAPLCG